MTDLILIEATGPERGYTASWLLASARELGFEKSVIRRAARGYLVPQALLDAMNGSPQAAVKMSPGELLETKIEPFDPGPDNVTATPPVAKHVEVPAPAGEPDDEPDRETVRAWAKEQGIEVAEKGQLKKALIAQYVAEHS